MSDVVLFSGFTMREIKLENRIVVASMCQYNASDGRMHDWHKMHLGQFSVSGAGLVMTEMTDVDPRGRIGPYCVGLYDDDCEAALADVVTFCRHYGFAKLGIQLAHAGRKSSILPPWQGRRFLRPEEGGWRPVAPSAIPLRADQPAPEPLSATQISDLVKAFVDAAIRAARIGFDLLELHAAHGYLLHQFLSPVTNQRIDEYGGSHENRMRFALEVFSAVRSAWPASKPMGVKVSAIDWCEGGITLEDTIAFCTRLRDAGCDYIQVSSGGIVWDEKIVTGRGYQVGMAEAIRSEVGIPVMAVGLIDGAHQAEGIVRQGRADLVALARGMLWNPRWAWHAARELGASIRYPDQYVRCQPHLLDDVFATGKVSG